MSATEAKPPGTPTTFALSRNLVKRFGSIAVTFTARPPDCCSVRAPVWVKFEVFGLRVDTIFVSSGRQDEAEEEAGEGEDRRGRLVGKEQEGIEVSAKS